MASNRIRIGILGGSGYGGAELLRILLLHPQAEPVFVTANEHAGKSVGEVHRNLYGLTDLKFQSAPKDPASLEDLDCVFLALPHGQAMEIVPRLPVNVKVIDLSGDFRLRDKNDFEQHYNREHTAMFAQAEFVYGLTETNREAIRNARLIANPGCSATATILGLAPLVANNLIDARVIVDAKTGSSGSGAKPAANTHHPQRMNSFYAYKPFTHQHVPDINWVKTTNFCDIGFAARGRQLVVFTALDNLVKGAAGQAVQNMNLMFGLDERTGLMLTGSNP